MPYRFVQFINNVVPIMILLISSYEQLNYLLLLGDYRRGVQLVRVRDTFEETFYSSKG